ncbi:uncharacterized protein [Bemisia tabaci]|uniref:uncharacterized protein isoform X1 n=1 Tax=Bemisia tabaci TaxID=7038 RepID=UPI0008F9934D|nr:PREDICTED: uncharacterized protein LOC109034746 isoform X1 [Bemisia tabaci]
MIGSKGSCVAILAVCFFSTVYGMECPEFFKADDLADKVSDIINHQCPVPIFGDDAKAFCCYGTNGRPYCCDFPHFALFVAILLIGLLILSSIVSCICCLCCPCCFCYKRRQGGGTCCCIIPIPCCC